MSGSILFVFVSNSNIDFNNSKQVFHFGHLVQYNLTLSAISIILYNFQMLSGISLIIEALLRSYFDPKIIPNVLCNSTYCWGIAKIQIIFNITHDNSSIPKSWLNSKYVTIIPFLNLFQYPNAFCNSFYFEVSPKSWLKSI